MDFKELNYVLALARCQNFTKAAESLYLSQPALTRFLQRLELSLGQPLFQRLGNKLVLTYAGERYVAKAQEILQQKKQLDEELQDIIQQHRGHLRVGLSVLRGMSMLPAVLPPFSQKYPKVQISVQEADPEMLEKMLSQGELDIAFFSLPVSRKEILTEKIRTEEIVLLLPPGDPLAKRAVKRPDCRYPWLDLEWVRERNFILQKSDQRTRQITDKLFKDYGIVPHTILEIQNSSVSAALAGAGYGCCFAREVHLRTPQFSPAPLCFSIGSRRTTTEYVAAYRQGVYLPDYARHFIDLVKMQLHE